MLYVRDHMEREDLCERRQEADMSPLEGFRVGTPRRAVSSQSVVLILLSTILLGIEFYPPGQDPAGLPV